MGSKKVLTPNIKANISSPSKACEGSVWEKHFNLPCRLYVRVDTSSIDPATEILSFLQIGLVYEGVTNWIIF